MKIMNAHKLTIFQGVKTKVAGFETEPNEESMKHAQACGSMPCGCARESRSTMVESDACLERTVRRVLIPSTKFELSQSLTQESKVNRRERKT